MTKTAENNDAPPGKKTRTTPALPFNEAEKRPAPTEESPENNACTSDPAFKAALSDVCPPNPNLGGGYH